MGTRCRWVDTGKARQRPNMTSALDIYRDSVFCLSPSGDSPTRKGLFDSLLAGCIPVVFNPLTLHEQYPWHIGKLVVEDIAIYIPSEIITGPIRVIRKNRKRHVVPDTNRVASTESLNFMNYLLNLSEAKVNLMQKRIENISWSLQYSRPPVLGTLKEDELLSMNKLHNHIWIPAYPDSVDVMLDKMFQLAENK